MWRIILPLWSLAAKESWLLLICVCTLSSQIINSFATNGVRILLLIWVLCFILVDRHKYSNLAHLQFVLQIYFEWPLLVILRKFRPYEIFVLILRLQMEGGADWGVPLRKYRWVRCVARRGSQWRVASPPVITAGSINIKIVLFSL